MRVVIPCESLLAAIKIKYCSKLHVIFSARERPVDKLIILIPSIGRRGNFNNIKNCFQFPMKKLHRRPSLGCFMKWMTMIIWPNERKMCFNDDIILTRSVVEPSNCENVSAVNDLEIAHLLAYSLPMDDVASFSAYTNVMMKMDNDFTCWFMQPSSEQGANLSWRTGRCVYQVIGVASLLIYLETVWLMWLYYRRCLFVFTVFYLNFSIFCSVSCRWIFNCFSSLHDWHGIMQPASALARMQ